MKNFNVEFFFYILASLCYAVFKISYVFYFAFTVTFIDCFINYFKTNDKYYLIKVLLFSIIIPNNYLIIFITFLLYALGLKHNKFNPYIILLCLFFILINILNNFHIYNFMFAIIYLVPIIFIYKFFVQNTISVEDNEKIIALLKKIIMLEFASIILYYIFNISSITSAIDNDWVVGTFGFKQGNIFLYFMAFCILMFKSDYSTSKNKKNVLYILLCSVMLLLTTSIALIMMFTMSFFTISFFSSKLKNKIKILMILGLMIIMFVFITPMWILKHINKLSNLNDKNYITTNIPKLLIYKKTFNELPKYDTKFMLMGNGAGEYSSRAAMTCTGEYVQGYKKIFPVSMSVYTKKYIYKDYINYNIIARNGTMYSPFSTIISVQGEYGIIGMVFFIIALICMFIKSNYDSKIFILFFLLSCFIENYLEFSKIMFMVSYIYYLNKKRRNVYV